MLLGVHPLAVVPLGSVQVLSSSPTSDLFLLPKSVIPSWSSDGTDVTFSLDDIEELTAEEADAVTGDSRKILFALLYRWYNWYISGIVQPNQMDIGVWQSEDTQGNGVTQFQVWFDVSRGSIEVRPE